MEHGKGYTVLVAVGGDMALLLYQHIHGFEAAWATWFFIWSSGRKMDVVVVDRYIVVVPHINANGAAGMHGELGLLLFELRCLFRHYR